MARFDRLAVYDAMLAQGLVPLFHHPDPDAARGAAAALARGGARLLEFTNRGDGASEVFRQLAPYLDREHPETILGAGSIEDAATAALFLAHGANFIVAPTFSPEVARLCHRRKVPYLPGCGTVSEIAEAEASGVEIVKLFPAGTYGPAFVKAVRGPRPWTRIMPTGGVTLEEPDLRAWFDAGVACVGIGSELVSRRRLERGEFDAIERATAEALARIARVRHAA
ncbi:MAG: bifunctional 4-hydroxy-2-oxoglutarate aldolase/2-dehydro-3-deoxy-phosphogluconate aldolase [Deinococcus-Thermus bacterium]|nr:bifunctional 4-hydroxy-2-oxoglutarate aldolase/2-dehydro-3-deoxy-phosphogluconate aldolase [Deinococcota bacterium]